MKLLDMEIGKVYESSGKEWRRIEYGIQWRVKGNIMWHFLFESCLSVTEVQAPHEWTPDELAVFRLISEEYKWIAKDMDGALSMHVNEPFMNGTDTFFESIGESNYLPISMPSIKPGEKYHIPMEAKK